MSGGQVCKCRPRRLWIIQYQCNHSAFNGYRWTPSDYSTVICRTCKTVWRTKAAYVDGPEATMAPENWENLL